MFNTNLPTFYLLIECCEIFLEYVTNTFNTSLLPKRLLQIKNDNKITLKIKNIRVIIKSVYNNNL